MSDGGSRWGRVAELGAVVGLLVASAFLGRLLVHNYVIHGDAPEPPGLRLAPASVSTTGLDGDARRLAIAGEERRMLLLVLSTDCRFCKQNMPNWVDLVARLEALGAAAPRVVTLSVDGPEVTSSYLRAHGLETDVRLIDSEVLPSLGLNGYPGSVAIDPVTRELRPWAGVLADADLEAIVQWASAPRADWPPATGGGP